jgi:hypothetical protein
VSVFREQWQACADLMRAKALEFDQLAEAAPPRPGLTDTLGKADWIWDNELQTHIPCCTRHIQIRDSTYFPKCGNGPLVGEAILSGDCGEHA